MSQVLDRLQVILGVKGEGFDQTKRDITGFTSGIQSQFAGLTKVIGAAFLANEAKNIVMNGAHLAEHFMDMKEQSGETYENVQKIDRAFKNIGKDGEIAFRSLDKFAAFAEKARTGTSNEDIDLLQRWGLSKKDLDDLHEGLTSSLPLVLKMFGSKGATNDNPIFRKDMSEIFGTKTVGAVTAGFRELKELGSVELISEKDGDRLHKALIDMAMMKDAVATVSTEISGPFAGAFDWLMKKVGVGNVARASLLSPLNAILRQVAGLTAESYKPEETYGAALPMPKKDKDVAEGFAKNREEAAWSVQSALDSAFFKVSNPATKADMLQGKIKNLMERANAVRCTDPKAAAALEHEAIGAASSLSELKVTGNARTMDSLAAQGGFAGGSAIGSIDSSLSVQEDMRSVLTQILDEAKITNSRGSPSANQTYP
jgi:hypothetical protein